MVGFGWEVVVGLGWDVVRLGWGVVGFGWEVVVRLGWEVAVGLCCVLGGTGFDAIVKCCVCDGCFWFR